MEQLIEIIKTIITAVLNQLSKPKPVDEQLPDLTPKKGKKKIKSVKMKSTVEKMKELAKAFDYPTDRLYLANRYSKREYDKSIAVVHFSWTKSLDSLTKYFHKHARSNSTWGIGKDGTVHRYLSSPNHSSWTQGVRASEKGGFINHKGQWVKNVNNIACSFEVVNISYQEYTEKQYKAVALRILWMLKYYPNFRIWYTTGHEQIIPIKKHDPGPKWDWEKLFVQYCGVTTEFYDEYLSYLDETSSYTTVGDSSRSERKLLEVREAVNKLILLRDEDKQYCF